MYASVSERDKAEAMAEGMERGKRDMAGNLLAEGVSQDIISKASGLSAEEIRSLMG
jgi:hypothetical protein